MCCGSIVDSWLLMVCYCTCVSKNLLHLRAAGYACVRLMMGTVGRRLWCSGSVGYPTHLIGSLQGPLAVLHHRAECYVLILLNQLLHGLFIHLAQEKNINEMPTSSSIIHGKCKMLSKSLESLDNYWMGNSTSSLVQVHVFLSFLRLLRTAQHMFSRDFQMYTG